MLVVQPPTPGDEECCHRRTDHGAHAEVQGPEDGSTLLPDTDIPVGRLVTVEVVDTDGVDLIARPILG